MPDRRAEFLAFAATGARRAPVTAAVARAAAEQPQVLDLLDAAPAEQRRPVLLLAALHDLVLTGRAPALARRYPTATAHPEPPDGLGPIVAELCRERRRELVGVLATRATQTNEVGRQAMLLPALHLVAAEVGVPLALLEVGASAGLNLLPERVRLVDAAGRWCGPAGAPIEVRCALRGERPAAPGELRIAHRRGIDLRPLDPADPSDARWLLACVWTDDLDRFRRLAAALGEARTDPPRVARADAVDGLADLLDAAPPGSHAVVVHSWVLPYLAPARRTQFFERLAAAGRSRDLSVVSIEPRHEVPELTVGTEPSRTAGATDVVLTTFRRGAATVQHLGEGHPHGAWLDWRPRLVDGSGRAVP